MKKYDLTIVGAGPCGLLAAKAAGQSGLEVALLDRKADITRIERTCGQTIVSMNDYYFNDLASYNQRGKRIAFLKAGFSFNYDGPVKNSYAWQIFSPDGGLLSFGDPKETRKKGANGAVALSYDKEILLRCLLEEVKEAGVDVYPGINVNELSTTADSVNITGSGKTFESLYAIAADGTNSRVARLMGFNKDRTAYCYLFSKAHYMSGVKAPNMDVLISSITYKTVAPGYMFIFPRPYGDDLTVIFLSLDPRVNLDDVADYYMKENPFFSQWFKKAVPSTQLTSAQYIFTPISEPYKNRVLLAGDTGSTQELENSGAMISGWKAGNAIARTLREDGIGLDPRGISDYIDWWKTTYIEGCRHEDYLMNFALPYVIDKEEELNYIFSLIKEPLPPCWNPYAAIKHMGQLIQGMIPTIQKERPEILPKLGKMATPMTEILEPTTNACKPLLDLD
jgi:flavin-dependent dehydrogenase